MNGQGKLGHLRLAETGTIACHLEWQRCFRNFSWLRIGRSKVLAGRSRAHRKAYILEGGRTLGVTERCLITALIPPTREVETMSNLPDMTTLARSSLRQPFIDHATISVNAHCFPSRLGNNGCQQLGSRMCSCVESISSDNGDFR